MNDIVTTQHLKLLIAKASDMEAAFVNVFLDDMVALIVETVGRGEEVCIDGLGTFRLVTTGGGRITRLVFYPDTIMKEGVNAPFAQFEPVVLNEGNLVVAAESAEIRDGVSAEAFSGKDNVEPNNLPVVNIAETEAEALVDVAKEDPNMKNESDLSEEKRLQEVGEDEKNQYQEELAQAEEPVVVSDGNGDMTKQVDEVVDKSVSEETGKSCDVNGCPVSEEIAKPRSGLKLILILLAICILATMVYFVIRINRSDKMPDLQQTMKPTSSTELRQEPVSKPSENSSSFPVTDTVQAQPASAASASTPKDSVISKQPLLKFPVHTTLKKGERLTLLALRYYGNKVFWVYIYEANKNKYPDPEEIPAGAQLIIQDPQTYQIDPKNPVSIRMAKEKAARILSY